MQETISLYLDLKKGEKADFEVVGRSAAAFAEAVKEIAFVIEPGIEVSLEFDSSAEGSLRLNAVIKSLKTPAGRRTALLAVIVAVGATLTQNLVSYGFGKFMDHFFSPDQRSQLSDEDVARIARQLKTLSDGKVAKEPVREIFKQLERDQTIKSVGATTKPDAKPIQPIPRSEFPLRAGIVPTNDAKPKNRKVRSVELLLLISPVLLPADRVWRFRSFFGEFSYHVDDGPRGRLLTGRRKIAMKPGIYLTVDVETHEEFEGGVWVPKERHITKIRRVHRKLPEPDLFAEPKKGKRGKK